MKKLLQSLMTLLILAGLCLLPLMTVGAADTETQNQLSHPLFTLTLGELIGITFGLGAFLLAVGKILWDWAQGRVTNPDDALTAQIQSRQQDRDWMDKMEKAYERSGNAVHKALETVTGVLATVAPVTSSIKVDDALLAFLKDLQQKGAPVPEPVPVAATAQSRQIVPSTTFDEVTTTVGGAHTHQMGSSLRDGYLYRQPDTTQKTDDSAG